MPPAEAPVADAAPVTLLHRTVRGWGGGPGASMMLASPASPDEVRGAVEAWRARHPHGGAIARGMGRSYGDAAQLADGLALTTAGLNGFSLDERTGVVTAAAGVTLEELLHALVPAGWMVPVVPGTQHVSIGGAIASDIHGKNHGVAGTFGSHVEALGLVTAAGEVLELRPGGEARIFEATLGGMGLTGVIVWARIRMRPVETAMLSVDSDRVETLEDALVALQAPGGPHRVAWLDLLGSRPGRGIVTRAEHVGRSDAPERAGGLPTVHARATVPAVLPDGILRPATVRLFNELRFRRAPRSERGRIESIGGHMFPLDALRAWPRLYGRSGLVQYQLVVPFGAEAVLSTVINRLRPSRVPCFLAVLKDFGPANDAPLSFPIAGWTLALDLPRAAPGLEPLLDELDELVVAAGGRVYLSKDARLRPDVLAAMYPRLDEWREIRDRADPDGVWRSDLAERTGLASARA